VVTVLSDVEGVTAWKGWSDWPGQTLDPESVGPSLGEAFRNKIQIQIQHKGDYGF